MAWFVEVSEYLGKGNWSDYAPLEFPTEEAAREYERTHLIRRNTKVRDVYQAAGKGEIIFYVSATDVKMDSGFHVVEMEDFPVDVPAGSYDQYHMYSHVGQNASNTTHRHEFGDVTICYDETSPKGEFTKKFPERRYVIICDQWTGKRLKVILPEYKGE